MFKRDRRFFHKTVVSDSVQTKGNLKRTRTRNVAREIQKKRIDVLEERGFFQKHRDLAFKNPLLHSNSMEFSWEEFENHLSAEKSNSNIRVEKILDLEKPAEKPAEFDNFKFQETTNESHVYNENNDDDEGVPHDLKDLDNEDDEDVGLPDGLKDDYDNEDGSEEENDDVSVFSDDDVGDKEIKSIVTYVSDDENNNRERIVVRKKSDKEEDDGEEEEEIVVRKKKKKKKKKKRKKRKRKKKKKRKKEDNSDEKDYNVGDLYYYSSKDHENSSEFQKFRNSALDNYDKTCKLKRFVKVCPLPLRMFLPKEYKTIYETQTLSDMERLAQASLEDQRVNKDHIARSWDKYVYYSFANLDEVKRYNENKFFPIKQKYAELITAFADMNSSVGKTDLGTDLRSFSVSIGFFVPEKHFAKGKKARGQVLVGVSKKRSGSYLEQHREKFRFMDITGREGLEASALDAYQVFTIQRQVTALESYSNAMYLGDGNKEILKKYSLEGKTDKEKREMKKQILKELISLGFDISMIKIFDPTSNTGVSDDHHKVYTMYGSFVEFLFQHPVFILLLHQTIIGSSNGTDILTGAEYKLYGSQPLFPFFIRPVGMSSVEFFRRERENIEIFDGKRVDNYYEVCRSRPKNWWNSKLHLVGVELPLYTCSAEGRIVGVTEFHREELCTHAKVTNEAINQECQNRIWKKDNDVLTSSCFSKYNDQRLEKIKGSKFTKEKYKRVIDGYAKVVFELDEILKKTKSELGVLKFLEWKYNQKILQKRIFHVVNLPEVVEADLIELFEERDFEAEFSLAMIYKKDQIKERLMYHLLVNGDVTSNKNLRYTRKLLKKEMEKDDVYNFLNKNRNVNTSLRSKFYKWRVKNCLVCLIYICCEFFMEHHFLKTSSVCGMLSLIEFVDRCIKVPEGRGVSKEDVGNPVAWLVWTEEETKKMKQKLKNVKRNDDREKFSAQQLIQKVRKQKYLKNQKKKLRSFSSLKKKRKNLKNESKVKRRSKR